MPKRAASPPQTPKASRVRTSVPKRAAASPPVTLKASHVPEEEVFVLEYYERFRSCNKRNGANARGGGTQTVTDATILSNLYAFVEGLDANAELRQQCMRLREFMVAYGVVRTFSGLSEENVLILTPLVQHLRGRRSGLSRDPVQEVVALIEVCERAGFNRNMSFASKCVCMLGHAVPIYSSEAIAYLTKHKGHRFSNHENRSYTAFHNAWVAEFEQDRVSFETAATKHLAAGPEALRSLERRLGAKWFGDARPRRQDEGGRRTFALRCRYCVFGSSIIHMQRCVTGCRFCRRPRTHYRLESGSPDSPNSVR